jgi:hypothetical protein
VWLETVLLIEAATAFWLSALNVALLLRVVSAARGPARRAAAIVLAWACAGQAMEALLFLWLGDVSVSGAWPAMALLAVRTALVVSTALIALLLVRASRQGR